MENEKEWWPSLLAKEAGIVFGGSELKLIENIIAEATRRARAEAFREVEEMANKIVGCHSCDDNGNGCDNAIALLQILTRLEAIKTKDHTCEKGMYEKCVVCGEKGKEV